MAKIGIALKMIYQGDQTPVVVNGSGWENYVDDNRSALLEFTTKSGATEPMRMITFCPTGMLIVQSINIDGRPSDLESIWLHIPDKADITGEEVRNLMSQANNLLLNKQRTMAQMQAIVAREYSDLPVYRPSQASPTNGSVAFRYLSSVAELDAVLGPSRYQAYYKPYKYIALLQRGGVVSPKNGVTDLSAQPVIEYVAVLPPSGQTLAQAGLAGASLSIKNDNGRNMPIDQVRWVNQGAKLTIVAERPGFAPQTWQYIAEDNGEVSMPANQSTEWKKQVRREDFSILSSKSSKPVINPTITINGKQLISVLEISDKETVDATVEVSAPDFESRTRKINLSARPPFSFMLDPKMSGKALTVRLADGSIGTLEYKSDNPNDRTSPLQGYQLQGSALVPKPKSEWIDRILGAVVGAMFVGIIWAAYSWFFTPGPQAPTPEPVPVPPTPEQLVESAIRYLDSNDVWELDSLAKYQVTQTIYNELKNYDFSKFLTAHPELAMSQRYQQLVAAMNANEKIIKTPGQGEDYPRYDSKNDSTINIASYIEFVSNPGRSHLNPSTLPVADQTSDLPAVKELPEPKPNPQTTTPQKPGQSKKESAGNAPGGQPTDNKQSSDIRKDY